MCLLALVQVRVLAYINRGLVLVALDSSRKPFDGAAIESLVLASSVVQEAVLDYMSHCMRAKIRYSACWCMCLACSMCFSWWGIHRRVSELTFDDVSGVSSPMQIWMPPSWFS